MYDEGDVTLHSYSGFAAVALGMSLLSAPAFAHGGHLGELAGHSHWVGVAALAGAALIAGVIALKGRKGAGKSETAGPQDHAEPTEAEATQ